MRLLILATSMLAITACSQAEDAAPKEVDQSAAQERGVELLSQIGVVRKVGLFSATTSFKVSVVQPGSSDDLWCDGKAGILYDLEYADSIVGWQALTALEEHGAYMGPETPGGENRIGESASAPVVGYINGLFVSAWENSKYGGVKVCDIGGVLPGTQKNA